jgi:hypothetical protein
VWSSIASQTQSDPSSQPTSKSRKDGRREAEDEACTADNVDRPRKERSEQLAHSVAGVAKSLAIDVERWIISTEPVVAGDGSNDPHVYGGP